MKKNILILLTLLIFNTLSNAQTYSEDNKKFSFGNFSYKISLEETDDQYAYKSFVNIYTEQKGDTSLYKSFEIPKTFSPLISTLV